jgi:hypothetical protein
MKPFDKFLLVLALIASIVLGIIFLPLINPGLSASLGAGAATFFNGLWVALIVLFWVLVGLGIIYAFFRFKRMDRTQVILDKNGNPVRAVIHKGELVQIPQAGGLDLAELMKIQQQQAIQMQQYWKMFGAATASMKNMAAFMDQYEIVDADEDVEVIGNATQTKQIAPPDNDLPTNVTYEEISRHIPEGHALLGVSSTGVETCDFGQLMTMWICGGSNTGKSNTVGIKIEEAIRNGRNLKIICIDYHARKKDSLYNKIRTYEKRFLLPVASNEENALNVLRFFLKEFVRRREAGSGEQDILLVVDEVPAVLDSEDEEITKIIKRIARICGRESRGFGMFGWFISQNAVGLAWLRNAVLTVIAHKMNMMNEAELACNQHKDIARDMENWPRGRVIVYGLNFTGVKVLQMPLMTQQPAPKLVDGEALTVSDDDEEFENVSTSVSKAETNGDAASIYLLKHTDELLATSSEKKSPVAEAAIKETIRRMKEAGMSDRHISKLVGLSGRKYGIYQAVLTELGYGQAEEGA